MSATRQVCEYCRARLGDYHYEGCGHGRPYRLNTVRADQCYSEPVELPSESEAPKSVPAVSPAVSPPTDQRTSGPSEGASAARTSLETTADAELLDAVALSGVEFDDPRLDYIVIQIDRDVWEDVRAAKSLRARAKYSEQARPQDAAATARRNND